ncbi:protein DCL homolog, chloroplastic isoform X2 [Hevea brasiliensis]|uniref:protein DCL homolog, chloroplastic isoform X2 n=1 Tax=Hevea brasiliensis TaxID=3981 RepID=UPI0025E5FDB4|nr:protein DCL homolog, chloroplastic isoform X2 [Hevea brasiliensis]
MNMASLSNPPIPACLYGHSNPISFYTSPMILSFPFHLTASLNPRVSALKTGSDGLRKPIVPPRKDMGGGISEDEEDSDVKRNYEEKEDEEWVDWEDQILEDTVPLVGFVRMILHSGKYENGDRLSPEHERTVVERLLPYHPECKKKIGCGIDYITRLAHKSSQCKKHLWCDLTCCLRKYQAICSAPGGVVAQKNKPFEP